MTSTPVPAFDDLWWAAPAIKTKLRHDPVAWLREQGMNVAADLPLPVVHEIVRVLWLLYVDGRLVPRDQFVIDPFDEGLLFGRGVWESTRTFGGMPWLWDAHVERLLSTAKLLNIAIDPARIPGAGLVMQYVRTLTNMDVVLRLNLTAGAPGRPGMVWMSSGFLPQPIEKVTLKTMTSPVAKDQPYLLWKTFQYATRLQIGQSARPDGYDSTLLLDDRGQILEAAHANIFFRLPEGWATPVADGGLLPGTVRRFLLEHSPYPARETAIPASRLGEVQEVFVTNSNVGLVPVTRIDGHDYPIGAETSELLRWLKVVTGQL